MGFLSKFEGKMEDTFEGAADRMVGAPISPVQIAKKAEKQMRREKMVGAGKQYAPTLYTVLVNPDDDERLFGYYPTLAGETETYLAAKAADEGLVMDGQPLVRFIVDDALKHGKFDIIAEPVAAPIVEQLRAEEMERYGIAPNQYGRGGGAGRQPRPGRSMNPRPADRYGDPVDDGYAARPARGGIDAAAAGALAGAAGAAGYDAGADGNTVVFAGGAGQQIASASASATHARLVDVASGHDFTLGSMRLLIGRESTNDIVVRDLNVSRTHAELRLERGTWVITDLGSTNGTFVNGREVSSQALYDGDRIDLGTTSFVFSQS